MDLATLTFYFTKYGAIAIFVIVFLEYLNLPGFPAGIIMPLSGIMAAKGNIHFFWVMVITVAAGLLGSLLHPEAAFTAYPFDIFFQRFLLLREFFRVGFLHGTGKYPISRRSLV